MSEISTNNTVTNPNDIKLRWTNPVNKLGKTTMLIAGITMFFPFLYLYIKYGELPPIPTIFAAYVGVLSSFLAGYIVEPLAFYNALGTAPTYMSFLSGSIGQMRVPSALVAKNIAEVKDNTQEAEIVSTCGVAGSVFMNVIIVTLTAIIGTIIVSVLPAFIMTALSKYVLPSIFGAVLALNTTKSRVKITVPVFLFALTLNYLQKTKVIALPGWSLIIICVAVGILVARLMFVKDWAE